VPEHELFSRALWLEAPWAVVEVRFDVQAHRLDLTVDFTEGSRFPCPVCGHAGCPVHDTKRRTWRHLDFFQHPTFLAARAPRVTCPTCGVHQVAVPWAREGPGFTAPFKRSEGEAISQVLAVHCEIASSPSLRSGSSQ